MAIDIPVDGSIFSFPDGWTVEKVDEWPEQTKVTGRPFHAKACDLVALSKNELWLIEAKDYSYTGASVPQDLAETVGLKVFHTLALLQATAHWGNDPHRMFCREAITATQAYICLAVELPDGGRKLMGVERPLADLLDKLKKVTRLLNVYRPIVSNHHRPHGVPWAIVRDPATRSDHSDR
ncbi:MAG: hypothetical protein LBM23_09765 [Propionibacteriaceae bacterium]|jgi:hypothetical protein|nr:hypothetical protein [Propionibacteriaceae bacterium]